MAGPELLAIAAPLAVASFIFAMVRPQFGAYLFLLANPLVVGIARGDLLPFMRPNEALLIMISLACAGHLWLQVLSGKQLRIQLTLLDIAFVAILITGSILPALLQLGREGSLTSDDILYSFVLWKYFLLYACFRIAIRQPGQVMVCLIISMAASSIVAIIGLLQVNNLFAVPELLVRYYDNPFGGHVGVLTTRATSTIASPFGVADTMIMNMLIACSLLAIYRRYAVILLIAATLFLSTCLAAGSFSGVTGLMVAGVAFGLLTGWLMYMFAAAIPVLLLAGGALWPVIAVRLEGFSRPSGLPQSWEGRLANLERFFLPELGTKFGWLLGVSPAPRVLAPETWREFVYIESGYVWLLWIGGMPFLIAFFFFMWIAFRTTSMTFRGQHPAPQQTAALTCMAYLVALAVLMLLDPHFTVRGSADLFFPLLALAVALPIQSMQVPASWRISISSARPQGAYS